MILHNAEKYNGDEKSLPQRQHMPNAVPFKEIESMQKLSMIINIGCVLTIIILLIPFISLAKGYVKENVIWLALATIFAGMSSPVHELLHAICYKKDVYFYNNLSQGLLFVVGTEDMSKVRFVLMCLCPNIVLGLLPYMIFLIHPKLVFFGLFGLVCLGMGFGDYINAYNAIKQMPKGARTYLNGMHSYWYLDKNPYLHSVATTVKK